MNITHSMTAVAITYAGMYAVDRWNRRPTAQARYARLSLRDKIAHHVRMKRVSVAAHAGIVVLFAGLYVAGRHGHRGFLPGRESVPPACRARGAAYVQRSWAVDVPGGSPARFPGR